MEILPPVDIQNTDASWPAVVSGKIRMSDKKVIRKRQVYTLIGIIAEVSGFADLLVIASGLLLGSLYTPRMYAASLVKHMGNVKLPKSKKKRRVKPSIIRNDLLQTLEGKEPVTL